MIAISYRREDSLPVAGRLYDRLQGEFGQGSVFMDFDSIPYGVDFRDHIQHMVEASQVLLAVIGPDWAGRRRSKTRRIDDEADFVRLEIAYALSRKVPVIPILIGKTRMPKPSSLPADIQALAYRNAMTLDVGIDFHHHAERLITAVKRLVREEALQADSAVTTVVGQLPAPSSSAVLPKLPDAATTRRARQGEPAGSEKSPAPRDEARFEDAPPVEPKPQLPLETIATAKRASPEPLSEPKLSDVVPLLPRGQPLIQASGPEQTVREPGAAEKTSAVSTKAEAASPDVPTMSPVLTGNVARANSEQPAPANIAPRSVDTKRLDDASHIRGAPQPKPHVRADSRNKIEHRESKSSFSAPASTPRVIGRSVRFVLGHQVLAFCVAAGFIALASLLWLTGHSPPAPASSASPTSTMPPLPARTAAPTPRPALSTSPASTPIPNRSAAAQEQHTGIVGKLSLGTYPDGGRFRVVDVSGRQHSGITPAVIEMPAGVATVTYSNGVDQHSETVHVTPGDTAISFWNFGASPTPQPTPTSTPESTPTLKSTPLNLLTAAASPPSLNEVASIVPSSEFTRNGRTWQAWIGEFIKAFVASSDGPDATATTRFFASEASVFGEHQGQEQINADIKTYNDRWPVRQDSIKGDIHLQEIAPDHEYKASYVQQFRAESAANQIWMEGEVAVDMQITIVDGAPKVSAITQKTLSRKKGRLSSNQPPNFDTPLPAIPVPGKPGIVHSPYAPSRGELDVRKYKKGTKVRCPYTGKIFIVP